MLGLNTREETKLGSTLNHRRRLDREARDQLPLSRKGLVTHSARDKDALAAVEFGLKDGALFGRNLQWLLLGFSEGRDGHGLLISERDDF